MDVCDFCAGVVKLLPEPDLYHFDLQKTTSFKESFATCSLCRVVYASIQQKGFTYFLENEADNVPHSITVEFRESLHTADDGRISEWTLRIGLPGGGALAVILAVWADEGSPAAQCLVTRPPILRDASTRTFDLVQASLHECIAEHKACRFSTASEEQVNDATPDLPTRVLEITGTPEVPSVRLLESNGRKGRYCALSHCWGRVQPLKTLSENLSEHLHSIPLKKLLKTFREAAALVRGLNENYLWIGRLSAHHVPAKAESCRALQSRAR